MSSLITRLKDESDEFTKEERELIMEVAEKLKNEEENGGSDE